MSYRKLNAAAPNGMRYCTHFNEFRPISEFSPLSRGPDGLSWYCREASVAKAIASEQVHWARKDITDAIARTRRRIAKGDDWQPVALSPEYLESINFGACHCCGAIPQTRVAAQKVATTDDTGCAVEVWLPEQWAFAPLKLHLDCVHPAVRQYCPGNVGYLCATCNAVKSDSNLATLLDRFDASRTGAEPLAVGLSPGMRLRMLALYASDPEARREHFRALFGPLPLVTEIGGTHA